MTNPALQISGLTKTRGKARVLDSVSLTLNRGCITAIVGPSGAGKSTLLRAVAGLEDCDHGTIEADGHILTDGAVIIRPEHRHIGMVFQDFSLFPHLSVIENVMFGLRSGAIAHRRERALHMLRQVHLESRARDYPHMLSGGEQQRIALARALAPAPSTILLDEAFSGLDSALRAELRDTALAAIAAQGAAALIVTHDAEEAMYMADTLALMIDGAIVQSGDPAQLYLEPVSAGAARLLGDINEWHGQVQNGLLAAPWGTIEAGGLMDGPASLLVRPEGIMVAEYAASQFAISTAHALGPAVSLAIDVPGSQPLRAKVPITCGLAPGQKVAVTLDPAFCRIIAQ